MRILYVLPAISHPAMRGELRHHHFLSRLAQRHAVTLIAMTRTQPPADVVADLHVQAEQLELVRVGGEESSSGPGDRSVDGVSAWHRRLAKRQRWQEGIRELAHHLSNAVRSKSYDVAMLYGAELNAVLPALGEIPLVADICDAASIRLRRGLRYASPVELPWRTWRWLQTARDEQRLLRRTDHVVFISERDRAAVASGSSTAAVIPNGVDIDFWKREPGPAPDPCLIFTGTMDYPPNADAATHLINRILPEVRKSVPRVRVVIAGRAPTASLLRLAGPGIEITGAVADLRPYLQRSAVFAAPLRFASGLQNKILEALAMQLPVVTTSVAAEGVRAAGAHTPVTVADNPAHFARAVSQLLHAPEARDRAGEAGRTFVARHFSWESNTDRLEQVCLEAAHERRRRAA